METKRKQDNLISELPNRGTALSTKIDKVPDIKSGMLDEKLKT